MTFLSLRENYFKKTTLNGEVMLSTKLKYPFIWKLWYVTTRLYV